MPQALRSIVLMVAILLSACANAPDSPSPADTGDPWESMNRRIYNNNYFFDRLLVRPLAELYRATIPPPVRGRIADITANMKEPVIFFNDVLQGDFTKAGITIERFGVNTTLGIGGMFDIASDWDLPKQTGDFGQTLYTWGVGEGPYMMLPAFGPSNLRDAIGTGVDLALSPWQYIVFFDGGINAGAQFEATSFGTNMIVWREQHIESIDALRADSLDPYVKLRSAWRQYRRHQLGEPPAGDDPNK